MDSLSKIREHAEIIGADGVHVGTVDRVEGDRIKLTRTIAVKEATKATITMSRKAWSQASRATKFASPPTRTSPSPSRKRKPKACPSAARIEKDGLCGDVNRLSAIAATA